MNEITHALRCLRARAPAYALYEAYYDGNHRLAFATDKFRSTFGLINHLTRESDKLVLV